MKSLIVKRNSSFSDIENDIKFIRENEGIKLRLPNSLREKGVLGLEGLVLLLLATWIRSGGKKVLHTFSKAGATADFEDLSSSMYGICGLQFSDTILSESNEEISRNKALELAYKRVLNLLEGNFSDAFKGTYLAIPSIKGHGKNKEKNCLLYHNGEVVDLEYCKHLVEKIINTIIPQKRRASSLSSMSNAIAEMIRELFDNTHKHGRTNERGDVLDVNFRGVIFNASQVGSDLLVSEISRTRPEGMIGFFLDWNEWIKKNDKKLPVLDITIVDAGPGYARRWTGKAREELSFADEKDAICKCFKKSNSTTGNLAAGYGLTHVLKELRQRQGWFRLRTGSISVSRSYFLDPLGSVEIEPKDVKKEKSFAEGSSFNIVIPLVDNKGGGK